MEIGAVLLQVEVVEYGVRIGWLKFFDVGVEFEFAIVACLADEQILSDDVFFFMVVGQAFVQGEECFQFVRYCPFFVDHFYHLMFSLDGFAREWNGLEKYCVLVRFLRLKMVFEPISVFKNGFC